MNADGTTTDLFFNIWYADQGDLALIHSLEDVQPANGIPDRVDQLIATLESAKDTYAQLGFAHVGTLDVFFGDPGVGAGIAVPPVAGFSGQIRFPRSAEIDYIPAHELFHQVQYQYAQLPVVVSANWVMEATAEWAAERAMTFRTGALPPEPSYAGGLPSFLLSAAEPLDDWAGYGEPRPYGGVIFFDYMTEHMGSQQDFVQNLWSNLGNQTWPDELSAVAATIEGYGSTIDYELPLFWRDAYLLCSPAVAPDEGRAATTQPVSFESQKDFWCQKLISLDSKFRFHRP